MSDNRENSFSAREAKELHASGNTEKIREAVQTIETYLEQTKEVLDRIEDYIRGLKGEELVQDKKLPDEHEVHKKEPDWFAKKL